VLSKREKGNHPATDVWAIGIILFLMAFRRHPFPQPGTRGLLEAIVTCGYSISEREKEGCSEELLDLLRLILVADHKSRPSPSQLLEHDWARGLRSSKEVTSEKVLPVKPV
jgi:serine/threonine protein kinase